MGLLSSANTSPHVSSLQVLLSVHSLFPFLSPFFFYTLWQTGPIIIQDCFLQDPLHRIEKHISTVSLTVSTVSLTVDTVLNLFTHLARASRDWHPVQ